MNDGIRIKIYWHVQNHVMRDPRRWGAKTRAAASAAVVFHKSVRRIETILGEPRTIEAVRAAAQPWRSAFVSAAQQMKACIDEALALLALVREFVSEEERRAISDDTIAIELAISRARTNKKKLSRPLSRLIKKITDQK